MRVLAIAILLLLASCRQPDASTAIQAQEQPSACHEENFEGSAFTFCAVKGGRVEVRSGHRSFAELSAALGPQADQVGFAMNAGMFDEEGRAIGLLVEDGRELHPINRRNGGGNFHLLPNGVFIVRRDGRSEVVESGRYKASPGIAFATQSGPMLLIAGKPHPRFEPDGESRNIRNGVGIAPDGTPAFVISNGPVSFGKMARFFRDRVHARDALYFDGSVSSLWDPAAHRQDSGTPLGPMVVVFRREESAPGRGGRARP